MEKEPNQKKSVMIVDDDQFLLNMYKLKFENSDYQVNAVTSGLMALEKLRSGIIYDAIIFDIVMPAMDGFEFAETVKKEKLAEKSALIALTNQGQPADIERGKNIGIDGYIIKASTIPSEVVKEVGIIIEKKNFA
jgi:two-component system chemotaxis sensor kinase CheA